MNGAPRIRGTALLPALLLTFLCAPASARTPFAVAPSSGPPVRVELGWRYEGIPPRMSLRELPPGSTAPLWSMGVSTNPASLPLGAEIPDGAVEVPRGGARVFALVYHNNSDAMIDLYAAPHHTDPASASLGLNFFCLCTGHDYRIPPGHYWYRVVKVELGPRFPKKRGAVRLTHTLMSAPDDSGW